MFRILDGREFFYQWDIDRKLIVNDNSITEVHFCNRTDDCSLVCEVYKEDGISLVNVPNILLQQDWNIRVYAYCGYTKIEESFLVRKRSKPADYVYTETEVKTFSTLENRMDELEATVSVEVAQAVEDYLTANPPEAGATQEEREQIEQNAADIEVLQEQSAAFATKEYVDNAVNNVDISKANNYPDWSNLKWYVMGDSLTDRNNNSATKRYYDFVQEKTGIQIILDGISGTGYGYGSGGNDGKSFADRVKNIPNDVDVVTIFGSVNDIRRGSDTYYDEVWRALSWLALNKPGLRIIIVPPALCKNNSQYNFRKTETLWKSYCDRLQEAAFYCDFRYVSDMYDCPPFNPNFTGHMEKFFKNDPEGIHPDDDGHKALAPYFYNALSQELALKV